MAQEHKVLRSIEAPGGGRCVDLFVRSDGSFGFEEYRREIEDGRGWYPIGFRGEQSFPTEEAAMETALAAVVWLKDVIQAP